MDYGRWEKRKTTKIGPIPDNDATSGVNPSWEWRAPRSSDDRYDEALA